MSTSTDDLLTPDNHYEPEQGMDLNRESDDYNNMRNFQYCIAVLIIFIAMVGCGIVINTQLITKTNSRIDRVILNGIQNDIDSMLSFSEVRNGISDCKSQLSIMQSNIAQLMETYDRMAKQHEESAMRFNQLSDQYNLMGQKLRGAVVAIE